MAEIELRLLCPDEEASFLTQVFNSLLDYPNIWSAFSSTVDDLRGVTDLPEKRCMLLLNIAQDRWLFTKPVQNLREGQKELLERQKKQLLRAMELVRQSLLKGPVLPVRSRGVDHGPDLPEELRPLPLVRQDGCLPFGSPVLVRQNGKYPP